MTDRQEEFEAAWAQIVADLSAPDPSPEPSGNSAGEPSGDSAAPDPEAPALAHEDPPGSAAGLAALFEPLRRDLARPEPVHPEPARPEPTPADRAGRGDPGAFVENWSDEGAFVPPTPPELPAGTPVTRLAWAGLLGGPSTFVVLALTSWDAPNVVWIGAGLAFLAGFLTLVWHLPEGRDDGWDDGAQV